MKADVVVDLQFGSTGKGALCGYLSMHNDYDLVVSANMPNAGHTAYDNNGMKWMHKVLPSGIFSPNLKYVCVGAGAVFSVSRLELEWENLCRFLPTKPTLIIHEAAGVLTKEHALKEKAELNGISSTMQGSAAALVDKIMRKKGAIAKDHEEHVLTAMGHHGRVRMVNAAEWAGYLHRATSVLVEGSQGYSLGISAGFYPYCTSRDCTPARVMADCGIPLSMLGMVYGSARTYPIRVGNTEGGYSGDWYSDQHEMTWEELGQTAEMTTVTGRVRRVANFSEHQMFEAMSYAMPDTVFLNFCNYGNQDYAINSIITSAHALGMGNIDILYGYGPLPSDIRTTIKRSVKEYEDD